MKKIGSLIHQLATHSRKKGRVTEPPVLGEAVRFPYGPFRFRTRLAKGAEYTIWSSTDLRVWGILARAKAQQEALEYVDSEAFKFSYRFYRLQVGRLYSTNVLGYASVSLPPGFSMIGNPFDSSPAVSEIFRGWPEATSLNKFDPVLFRLGENMIKHGKWTNPAERFAHSEGAIFFNPTSDYKSASFSGEVVEGHWTVPIPSGFSVRSAPAPQPGNLVENLKFPIGNGDVIHLFDRERQKYMLYPFADGQWTEGEPVVGVGESFWVAKTEPGNWNCEVVIGPPEPSN